MGSPFARQRARMLAAAASLEAAAPVHTGAAATEYELMRAKLGLDLRRLHEIQSIERKIELKRELIPSYVDWVHGVLDADSGATDDILLHVMIWLIDTNAIPSAMPLVRYVLRHQLSLPERFERTAPTYICEEIAESALKRLGQEPAPEVDDLAGMIAILDDVAELVADEDIFDQVRAKLEKAQGLADELAATLSEPGADGPAGVQRARQERAIAHLTRALELDPAAGVKKKLEQLKRAARKLEGESS